MYLMTGRGGSAPREQRWSRTGLRNLVELTNSAAELVLQGVASLQLGLVQLSIA